jgi:hypothetical protein
MVLKCLLNIKIYSLLYKEIEQYNKYSSILNIVKQSPELLLSRSAEPDSLLETIFIQ